MDTKIKERIEKQLNEHDIVLYMKGTPDAPSCGFSAEVSRILKQYHVPFFALNVLEDDAIRQGIKVYSAWPTIPQLYILKNFIGGFDIVQQEHQNGQLKMKLQEVLKHTTHADES